MILRSRRAATAAGMTLSATAALGVLVASPARSAPDGGPVACVTDVGSQDRSLSVGLQTRISRGYEDLPFTGTSTVLSGDRLASFDLPYGYSASDITLRVTGRSATQVAMYFTTASLYRHAGSQARRPGLGRGTIWSIASPTAAAGADGRYDLSYAFGVTTEGTRDTYVIGLSSLAGYVDSLSVSLVRAVKDPRLASTLDIPSQDACPWWQTKVSLGGNAGPAGPTGPAGPAGPPGAGSVVPDLWFDNVATGRTAVPAGVWTDLARSAGPRNGSTDSFYVLGTAAATGTGSTSCRLFVALDAGGTYELSTGTASTGNTLTVQAVVPPTEQGPVVMSCRSDVASDLAPVVLVSQPVTGHGSWRQ
jgi:hypothetical protein